MLVPVLLCVLCGYGLARIKAPFDNKMVSDLVSNIGYPTLVLAHLEGGDVTLGAFLEMLLAAVIVVACFGLAGFVFPKAVRLSPRAFLSPMMFNNVGNIGLPVSLLAFGDQGLAFSVAFLVVLIGIFTIGIWLPMGEVSLGDLARKPVIYAVIIAIPLMLLTLGHTLATLKAGNLWRGTYLALFHLAMAAAVAFVLVQLFAFEGTARGVFILQCMMPVSVATYLWVEMYTPDKATDVAGFILVSTLLAIFVLPLVLTLWI